MRCYKPIEGPQNCEGDDDAYTHSSDFNVTIVNFA